VRRARWRVCPVSGLGAQQLTTVLHTLNVQPPWQSILIAAES